MKSISRFSSLAVSLVLIAAAPSAHASDAAKAAETAKTLCAGCHGADGKTPLDPSYAIIAGQYESYLVTALKAYKNGDRKNAMMSGIAAGLSKQDIYGLAKYFAGLPGPLNYK